MYADTVEIYSDETNAAVLRHPGRHYPGVLVQGDTLYALCRKADDACAAAKVAAGSPGYEDINRVRNALWDFLNHYKRVLDDHGIAVPFSEDH